MAFIERTIWNTWPTLVAAVLVHAVGMSAEHVVPWSFAINFVWLVGWQE